MAATFTITPNTATFHALIQGSSQATGDLQRLTLAVYLDDPLTWPTLLPMVTTKYHVHSPVGADVVIDIVRGPGVGTLTVDAFGTGLALLVDLRRDRWLPTGGRTMGSADFLVTSGTF